MLELPVNSIGLGSKGSTGLSKKNDYFAFSINCTNNANNTQTMLLSPNQNLTGMTKLSFD
jgi:hypothetical protein